MENKQECIIKQSYLAEMCQIMWVTSSVPSNSKISMVNCKETLDPMKIISSLFGGTITIAIPLVSPNFITIRGN